jgi:subtilisin family serine protease
VLVPACTAAALLAFSLAAVGPREAAAGRFPPAPKVQQRKPSAFGASSLKKANGLIRAFEAQNDPRFLVDGTGLTVALLDSGLNVDHVDFAGAGRIPARRNFTTDDGGDPDKVTDGYGHGSNVGGIMVAHGKHTGVARGANIVPVKVLNNDGRGDIPEAEAGLKWVIDNREQYRITVVVLTLADGGNYDSDAMLDPKFGTIRSSIQRLRNERVAVVVAAGNFYALYNIIPVGGPAGDPGEAKQGMSLPAIFREAVSVGAVYDDDYHKQMAYQNGELARRTNVDWFTPFTQRLHEDVGKECRTDIFAPGALIESSGKSGTDTDSEDLAGTSQAAPFVAGVILLIQQYHFKENSKLPCVDHIESWMRSAGVPIVDGDDEDDNVKHTHKKFLRLDALGALVAAKNDPCKH